MINKKYFLSTGLILFSLLYISIAAYNSSASSLELFIVSMIIISQVIYIIYKKNRKE